MKPDITVAAFVLAGGLIIAAIIMQPPKHRYEAIGASTGAYAAAYVLDHETGSLTFCAQFQCGPTTREK